MAGESSFRSRLREALQQSAVRRSQPTVPGLKPRPTTPEEELPALKGTPQRLPVSGTPPPGPASSEHQGLVGRGFSPAETQDEKLVGRGFRPAETQDEKLVGRGFSPAEDTSAIRYDFDDDPRERAKAEQAAWIAELLGGAWQSDGRGTCLVIDRIYAADRRHGNADIGEYAEALAKHQHALYAFDASMRSETDSDMTLFSSLGHDAPSDSWTSTSEVQPASPGLAERRSKTAQASGGGFLFFDLETTGLSGGAGTCAFLIGYGWFEGHDFRTRQYFLGGYGHEAAMLRMACKVLDENRTLASFNGKTFDVPLIQGRYLFHRIASPFDEVPHIDLLQPARRLWRHRPFPRVQGRGRERDDSFGSYFRSAALRQQYRAVTARNPARRIDLSDYAASCALGVLEEAILGFDRLGDVPGAEIPSRYFDYARTGNARQLAPVLEHNRLDLLSLAAVASVIARMLHEGAGAARNAHECLALGRLYERSGEGDRAADFYPRAATGSGEVAWSADSIVQREALRHLAIRYRRERRWEDAASAWKQLLALFEVSETARHDEAELEALVALAVHHEHRSKDLNAARALVVRALNGHASAHEQESLRHRLARLERKLAGRQPPLVAPRTATPAPRSAHCAPRTTTE